MKVFPETSRTKFVLMVTNNQIHDHIGFHYIK